MKGMNLLIVVLMETSKKVLSDALFSPVLILILIRKFHQVNIKSHLMIQNTIQLLTFRSNMINLK
jgi:hypothetical protein